MSRRNGQICVQSSLVASRIRIRPACHAPPTVFFPWHTIERYRSVTLPTRAPGVHCGAMRSRLTGVLLAALTLFATVLAGSASADTKVTNGGDTHSATNHHHHWTKLAL